MDSRAWLFTCSSGLQTTATKPCCRESPQLAMIDASTAKPMAQTNWPAKEAQVSKPVLPKTMPKRSINCIGSPARRIGPSVDPHRRAADEVDKAWPRAPTGRMPPASTRTDTGPQP